MSDDRTGEEDFEALRKRMKRPLASLVRRMRVPVDDVEDVLQKVFMQYHLKRSQIQNPEAWFYGATRREGLMHLRTLGRRLTIATDESILELVSGGSTPDPERELMKGRLGEWIAALKPTCRKLLRLKYLEELEPDEIAERTGYKRSSLDKVIRRCLSALRRKIDTALGRTEKQGKRDDP
jgi:RNA polymerase sigma factor (sigma-70 family)